MFTRLQSRLSNCQQRDVYRAAFRLVAACLILAISVTTVSAQIKLPQIQSGSQQQAPSGLEQLRQLFAEQGEQTTDTAETEIQQIEIPFYDGPLAEEDRIETNNGNVTIAVRELPLGVVLNAIARKMQLNIVSSSDVAGQVSITLTDVPLSDALDAILSVNGYSWVRKNNIILVSSLTSTAKLAPQVQGRVVRVFKLNYVSATDVDKTVKGLLSPVGQSFVSEVDPVNKLKTREEIVVEDMPDYVRRIESYIYQADVPPAQVLIEAHVLQVELQDDIKHGVNFKSIASIAGADVTFETKGFANSGASPAFFVDVDGTDLESLLEALKTTTDAKTLASPKVLAVNGQEARIQIGEQLGYFVTTTTQTSTLQDVSFIDLGVVLRVTPVISRDGQILMTVKPEVSTGQINPLTGLPEEETTEVETTVLLPNGHAMLIGGLIKQENSDSQTKIPKAGDLPIVGRLFQRRQRLKKRSEIIITLIPRVVPYEHDQQVLHLTQVQRSTTPLLHGALKDVDRRFFEPELPDACKPIRDEHRGPVRRTFVTPPVAYSPFFSQYNHVPEFLEMCPPENSLPPISQPASSIDTGLSTRPNGASHDSDESTDARQVERASASRSEVMSRSIRHADVRHPRTNVLRGVELPPVTESGPPASGPTRSTGWRRVQRR